MPEQSFPRPSLLEIQKRLRELESEFDAIETGAQTTGDAREDQLELEKIDAQIGQIKWVLGIETAENKAPTVKSSAV